MNGIRGVAVIALLARRRGCGLQQRRRQGWGLGWDRDARLASDDPPDREASQQVKEFARQVRRLSDGRLRIHIDWEANGSGARHPLRAWDQKTAQKVVDGRYALAVVPARAWDVLGVTSLQAIQAPFLVNSDALLDKVTSDPVAEKMLAGLDDVGVVGLALWPEALRHPVGFGHPLRSPSDFAGKGIRAIRSALTWEILRALGARPLDRVGNEIGTRDRQRETERRRNRDRAAARPAATRDRDRERHPLPQGEHHRGEPEGVRSAERRSARDLAPGRRGDARPHGRVTANRRGRSALGVWCRGSRRRRKRRRHPRARPRNAAGGRPARA